MNRSNVAIANLGFVPALIETLWVVHATLTEKMLRP